MNEYRTQKIALPSGQVIEIMYLIDPDQSIEIALEEHAATTTPHALPLHCCPSCASEMVYPMNWHEQEDGLWTVERRCPNCEWYDLGTFVREEIEPYDDIIEAGTEELIMELRTWSHSNMNDDVERLIAAIQDDQIQPIDF